MTKECTKIIIDDNGEYGEDLRVVYSYFLLRGMLGSAITFEALDINNNVFVKMDWYMIQPYLFRNILPPLIIHRNSPQFKKYKEEILSGTIERTDRIYFSLVSNYLSERQMYDAIAKLEDVSFNNGKRTVQDKIKQALDIK